MRTNIILTAIVMVWMVITGLFVGAPTWAQRFGIIDKTANQQDNAQTVISIPVETGTFTYKNLNQDEAMPYGPNSISITDEGNVLVGNSLDNTATELSPAGDIITKVKFAEATAINDVRKLNGRYFAIDRTADAAQVVSDIGEKTKTGKDSFRFSAPGGWANVSEIAIADLQGRENALGSTSMRQRPDKISISPGRPFDENANVLRVWRNSTLIAEWEATRPIAETRLLGSLSNGDFFVMVYEMIGTDRILFDQRVLHFDANGNVIEMARVPQYQYYNVANDTVLAADGNVYVLMPLEKSLDVIRLNFKSRLPDLETIASTIEDPQPDTGALSLTLPSVTRQQIESAANYYFNTPTYVPASRVNATCRIKPSYITGAGSYNSVPYSWGQWDSPRDFSNKMSGSTTIYAGHVANFYSSCSVRPAGVDCSGFVGQTWGLPGHPFYTGNVVSSGYARTISWQELRKGDALNWSGNHIMLFVSGSYGNSISTWEATGDPGIEKAARNVRPWSQARNYQPIRYNGLAVTNPTARISATSSYGVQYEGSTGTYNVSPGGSILFTFDSARSSSNAGSINSWTWKINGTLVSQGSRFSFTLGRGIHTVSLKVTNTEGGSSTASLQITINEVQIISRPTISSYTWNSTPYAGMYFSGTIYGTNFVMGGTRLFFCNSSNTCYEHPMSLNSVTSSTRMTVSNVRLSAGYWTMFARNAAGDSPRSSSFYVR
jgi:hypothetical protein